MNKTEESIKNMKEYIEKYKIIPLDIEALQHLISVAERGMDRDGINIIIGQVMYLLKVFMEFLKPHMDEYLKAGEHEERQY